MTRIGWAPQTVWVHGDTFLIVQRSQRRQVGEVETELVTLLADYRPVAGVQLPHRLSVFAGDRLLHETKFRRVEANPWIPPGWFSAPKTRVAGP